MAVKKLIEVALPLEKINAESAREKSIRHGHPSTLHLWWARRPLAAARAVIWSSLVDDPSSHPEQFPTEEAQNAERQRLFSILEDLVVWENSNNPDVLDKAKIEIRKSTGGNPPELLDPFAGGGAIPLEAQRLGLQSNARDLNPVAVMINKAMIEIPSKFSGNSPVNPEANQMIMHGWPGSTGLAEDIRFYGEKLKQKAFSHIGHLYPNVRTSSKSTGGRTTVIAWLWTRTVKCPNPACNCQIPLASSFVLSTKKGNEAWAEPQVNGTSIEFVVHQGKCPPEKESNKVGRSAVFKCVSCGEITTDDYVKENGKAHKLGAKLMCVVGDSKHGRLFLNSDIEQELAANVSMPDFYPDGAMPNNPRWFSPPGFGLTNYSDLFTPRQMNALVTFSSLLDEVQREIEQDAISYGYSNDHISLSNGGLGAKAYSEAVRVYLAFTIGKLADRGSTLCRWDTGYVKIGNTFGRQALPMVWSYAESNPFSGSTGSFDGALNNIIECVQALPGSSKGSSEQNEAQNDNGLRNVMVSTDPPYYDNIGYADLSDYFYLWMRNSLKDIYPDIFHTLLVPKASELVATPYRFNGSVQKAKDFFENGMLQTCRQIYIYAKDDIPVTIYYAYKQSETTESAKGKQTASTGWETMLTAIINAGFAITGTWPMRTELSNRLVASGTNALASSIVLVCRKRQADAPQTTRRNLINILRRELRPALKKLQDSNIAPVDLAQSAIGPGMGVFSRFRKVLDADGAPMTVRSALQVINEEIDLYFNEQIGEMDAASRFCVDLFSQYAYNEIKYGEAEVLANAKGTSIPMMASHGVLYAKAGIVHLVERKELPEKVDPNESNIWMLTQQLTQAMAKGGVEACAQIIAPMFGSNAEKAKDLAYRLYTIAEQKKWAEEAYAYNALVVAWPDIQTRAASLKVEAPEQLSMF